MKNLGTHALLRLELELEDQLTEEKMGWSYRRDAEKSGITLFKVSV